MAYDTLSNAQLAAEVRENMNKAENAMQAGMRRADELIRRLGAAAPIPVPSPDPISVPVAYASTLVDGLTPPQIDWAGRPWRVNMGSSWNPGMDHCLQVAGGKARFELRNTLLDKSKADNDASAMRRAELSGSLYGDPVRLPNGVPLWGGFTTKHHAWADPVGMRALSGGVYGQIHMGSKFGGSPALAFRRDDDGTLKITTRGENNTSGTTQFQGPLSFDKAHDIVFCVTLHETAGGLQVWIDGAPVIDVSGKSIGHSNAEHYWNLGLYFSGGITCPVVAEYANHVYPAPGSLIMRIARMPDLRAAF